MSVIVRRRTRVSQSSHCPVAKLLSIARPCLYPGIRVSPSSGRKSGGQHAFTVLHNRITPSGRNVSVTTQLADEGEQRQVHGDDHATHDEAEKNDHDGFESSQQVFHGGVDFFFVEISDFLKHGVHGTRLFADGNHLRNHTRKHFGFFQRLGERLAFLDRSSHLLQAALDDGLPASLGGHVQTLKDVHAAGDQRTEGSGKSGHGDFSHQQAQNRELQDDGIEDKAALRSSVPDLQSQDNTGKSDQDKQTKNTADEIAHGDDDFCGQGQVHAKAREQGGENRNDLPEQQGDNARGNAQA